VVTLCQPGKETFDGIEPGTGRWREGKKAGSVVHFVTAVYTLKDDQAPGRGSGEKMPLLFGKD
jgi:hypothetical protein